MHTRGSCVFRRFRAWVSPSLQPRPLTASPRLVLEQPVYAETHTFTISIQTLFKTHGSYEQLCPDRPDSCPFRILNRHVQSPSSGLPHPTKPCPFLFRSSLDGSAAFVFLRRKPAVALLSLVPVCASSPAGPPLRMGPARDLHLVSPLSTCVAPWDASVLPSPPDGTAGAPDSALSSLPMCVCHPHTHSLPPSCAQSWFRGMAGSSCHHASALTAGSLFHSLMYPKFLEECWVHSW